ncbi:MAG: DNA-binding domain-containing protein [Chloroflexota bacterium]
MTIFYSLHKNPLTNGANHYRALVQSNGSVDLAGVIDRMIAHGSTITKADALATLQDFFAEVSNCCWMASG